LEFLDGVFHWTVGKFALPPQARFFFVFPPFLLVLWHLSSFPSFPWEKNFFLFGRQLKQEIFTTPIHHPPPSEIKPF